MSDPIINGTKGAYLQPRVYGVNEQGAYILLEYQGTRNEIAALADSVLVSGGTFEISESFTGAADRLVARYPTNGPEQPVNDWELFAQVEVKDILETDIPVVRSLTSAQKKAIRDALNTDTRQSPALTTAEQIELFTLMKSDPTLGQRVVAPTLRHTITFSNNAVIDAALTNVEEIISTATLIVQEVTMLDRVKRQLPAKTDPVFSDDVIRRYGWLKEYPTVRVSANQRCQLVQEFMYGLWPVIQYGVPI